MCNFVIIIFGWDWGMVCVQNTFLILVRWLKFQKALQCEGFLLICNPSSLVLNSWLSFELILYLLVSSCISLNTTWALSNLTVQHILWCLFENALFLILVIHCVSFILSDFNACLFDNRLLPWGRIICPAWQTAYENI